MAKDSKRRPNALDDSGTIGSRKMSEKAEHLASIVLYQTEDGDTRTECRFDHDNLWPTQAQIAGLFQTTPQNVTLHLKAIFDEGELSQSATFKEYLQARKEGKRKVSRTIQHYRLEAILAVGYRVRSIRGTQFCQWATSRLSEFFVKGFVMDDERLKNPGGLDYFDELLARIRHIRALEKRFDVTSRLGKPGLNLRGGAIGPGWSPCRQPDAG